MAPIKRGALAEEIVSYIREQILEGEMKPGEKIDQDAIGEFLDVSRSPIREALVVLGQEGLVVITPRRGAFVAEISPDDVIDHYELFGLVSGRVAAMAAESFTDEQLAELQGIHDRFAASSNDDHFKLNEEFHQLVNSVAPRRTRWLLRNLQRSIPSGFFETTPDWDAQAVRGHGEIVEAILARDVDAARRAMETHLHDAGVAAVEGLTAKGFWETEDD